MNALIIVGARRRMNAFVDVRRRMNAFFQTQNQRTRPTPKPLAALPKTIGRPTPQTIGRSTPEPSGRPLPQTIGRPAPQNHWPSPTTSTLIPDTYVHNYLNSTCGNGFGILYPKACNSGEFIIQRVVTVFVSRPVAGWCTRVPL